MQLDETGKPCKLYAAMLGREVIHVAVHTEVLAMAIAAANSPEDGQIDSWVDCQAVVTGLRHLRIAADDHKNYYAGFWSGHSSH